MTRRELARFGAVSLAATLRTAQSDFPSRNIDFIITKAPGGGFDSLVRMFLLASKTFCRAE